MLPGSLREPELPQIFEYPFAFEYQDACAAFSLEVRDWVAVDKRDLVNAAVGLQFLKCQLSKCGTKLQVSKLVPGKKFLAANFELKKFTEPKKIFPRNYDDIKIHFLEKSIILKNLKTPRRKVNRFTELKSVKSLLLLRKLSFISLCFVKILKRVSE